MRLSKLIFVLIGLAVATPAVAQEPAATSPVVILRGSSAPPQPWYEPPPPPRDAPIATVPYVLPYYYPYYPYYLLSRHMAPPNAPAADKPAAAQFHPR